MGGIVGASVSASFLFLIACANTYYLTQAIKERRGVKRKLAAGEPVDYADDGETKIHGGGCLIRIIGPLLRSVNRPWKMYPVGILFGFGMSVARQILTSLHQDSTLRLPSLCSLSRLSPSVGLTVSLSRTAKLSSFLSCSRRE